MAFPRQRVPELMDDPGISATEHRRALRGLCRLNALACLDRAIWPLIAAKASAKRGPIRVLDVAAGAGDMIARLARRASIHGAEVQWHACDKSEEALRCASAAAQKQGVTLTTHALDVLSEPLPGGFDVAYSGLFLHHFDPPKVETILRAMSNAAKCVIVQDLRRTYQGMLLARVVPRLVTRSHVVHTDAVLSVRAAYTMDELIQMAAGAGMAGADIRPMWPQRMLMTWEKPA